MKRIWSSRPSPALVVAVVALVAALAGTAVAADTVSTKSAKVTKQTVRKIAKRVAKKQAKRAVNKKFPIGASDLAAIDEHNDSVDLPPGTASGVFTDETATANCDSDEQVISGGWSTQFEDDGVTKLAFPVSDKQSDNGWEASAVNLSSSETNELTVHAYCLAP